MRDQYKVLQEKYSLVNETNWEEKYTKFALDCLQANTFEEFFALCEEVHHGVRNFDWDVGYLGDFIGNIITKNTGIQKTLPLAKAVAEGLAAAWYKSSYGRSRLEQRQIKRHWENSYTQSKIYWDVWYKELSKYRNAQKRMQQQNKDTGINLDI